MKPIETEHPELFEGLRGPQPSRELRDRTLRAANAALVEPPPSTLWERIWTFRPVRWVYWATAVAALIGHLALPEGRASSADGGVTWADVPRLLEQEFVEVLSVPRFRLTGLTFFGEPLPSDPVLPSETSVSQNPSKES